MPTKKSKSGSRKAKSENSKESEFQKTLDDVIEKYRELLTKIGKL